MDSNINPKIKAKQIDIGYTGTATDSLGNIFVMESGMIKFINGLSTPPAVSAMPIPLGMIDVTSDSYWEWFTTESVYINGAWYSINSTGDVWLQPKGTWHLNKKIVRSVIYADTIPEGIQLNFYGKTINDFNNYPPTASDYSYTSGVEFYWYDYASDIDYSVVNEDMVPATIDVYISGGAPLVVRKIYVELADIIPEPVVQTWYEINAANWPNWWTDYSWMIGSTLQRYDYIPLHGESAPAVYEMPQDIFLNPTKIKVTFTLTGGILKLKTGGNYEDITSGVEYTLSALDQIENNPGIGGYFNSIPSGQTWNCSKIEILADGII